jgi:hypothetical protein
MGPEHHILRRTRGRANLRDADLTKAKLLATNLEEAKVFGCVITGAKFRDNPDVWVDNSKDGDGSQKIKLADWIALGQKTDKTS